MMGNVDAFLKSLQMFDKDNVPENCVAAVEKEYLSQVHGYTYDYIIVYVIHPDILLVLTGLRLSHPATVHMLAGRLHSRQHPL